MRTMPDESTYALTAHVAATMSAPDLPYQPRKPAHYHPKIGLIACGGITGVHLRAYAEQGYDVVALCDLIPERAEGRRAEFFPNASVTTDYRDLLKREDIEVVDIATHPAERVELIEAALNAGKHVLSQKPFVLDLDTGERLVALADEKGKKLAVNQNGRWAPHFAYMHRAAHTGLLGTVQSAHASVHWDHSWTKGTPFEKIFDLVFYDFAIHWFDWLAFLMQDRPVKQLFGMRTPAASQDMYPPLLAQAMVQYEGAHASLVFDAYARYGQIDRSLITGTDGTISSSGSDLSNQTVVLTTAAGAAVPHLQGIWFPDGFKGTMGELLCAIEEDREPTNSARSTLRSLALCFAAIASANEGAAKVPGQVRQLP
jgi:predicted dehydrogenase